MENSVKESRASFDAAIASELGLALAEATDGRMRVDSVVTPPLIILEVPSPIVRPDIALEVDADGRRVQIAVETLRSAYPRDIQGAIWTLSEFKLLSERRREQPELILLVAAEALSPGSREMLRDRGIGYFERNGNLRLNWRNWLINIERPALPSAKRVATSLFTDSREMVVHALLTNREKWMTVHELSETSRTSLYTCSLVLQELERREWCESSDGRPHRRRLTKPRQLLDAWATHWMKRKEKRSRWYAFTERPNMLLENLEHRIQEAGVSFDWAFTGAAAANIYAPLLTSVETAEIIVPPGHAESLASEMGLKPADKGANVTFVERDGASLLFCNGFSDRPSRFASPFILYLDLLDGRGRNKELAQHVLETLEL